MGMAIRMNIGQFKEQLRATVDKLHAATRPAAPGFRRIWKS